MNLRACYRQAIEEFLVAGKRYSTSDVFGRAMEINGAEDEFTAKAVEKASAHARREIKELMREFTDSEVDENDPVYHGQESLFSLLPHPTTRAVALPDELGDYSYKSYGSTTDGELAQSIDVKKENIERATRRLRNDMENRDALMPFRVDDETTTLEALREMERRQKGAA